MAQGVAIGLVALLFILLAWSLLNDEGGGSRSRRTAASGPLRPTSRSSGSTRTASSRLSSLRGKVVVLNVWASWCIPCKEEAPFLEQVWRRTVTADVVVLGLDAKDFRADARRFAERFGLTFPLVYDGPGDALDGTASPASRDVRDRPRGGSSGPSSERWRTRTSARLRAAIEGALGVMASRPLALPRSLARRRAGRSSAGAAAERRRPRGGARLSRLRDDARSVERAGRASG